MIVGINTSPLAGRDGDKLTARQIHDRLMQELVGNVSIRVTGTDRPDAWEVQGRGEVQLVVLLELMRREGYELTAGQPQVLTLLESTARSASPSSIRDLVPRTGAHVGVVTHRRSRSARAGWSRWSAPRRAGSARVPGPRPRTDRVHTGFPHRDPWHRAHAPVFDRWSRGRASCAPARPARSSPTARARARLRAVRPPGARDDVHRARRGGLRSRRRERALSDDLDVNATREKHQTNVRAASADGSSSG